MNTEAILLCILSSTVTATVLTSLKELWLWRLNRKAKLEDTQKESRNERIDRQIIDAMETLARLDAKIAASCNSSKFVMKDMIRDTISKHVEAGEVTLEDRTQVHEMWHIYHYELGGNGDLDAIMSIFDELPIKL